MMVHIRFFVSSVAPCQVWCLFGGDAYLKIGCNEETFSLTHNSTLLSLTMIWIESYGYEF